MSNRMSITLLITMVISAVLFGIGAVAVLGTPALAPKAPYLLPAVVILSFLVAPFIAWQLAPRLTARHIKRETLNQRQTARPGP